MPEKRYWIDLFTPETWREFLDAGGETSGFPYRMRRSVSEMAPGDVLLCYVAGISRWIGALEVVGGHFSDDTPIWSTADYPERVKVRRLIELTFETAVPAVDIKGDMKMFASLRNPNQWSIYFRRSPSSITEEDAAVVLAALEDARDNPFVRPIPPGKLTAGPQGRTKVTKLKPDAEPADEVDEAEPLDLELDDVEELEDEEAAADAPEVAAKAPREHSEMQWLLLGLGADMGMNVWAPKPDRGMEWEGHRIGDVPRMLEALPVQFDRDTMRTIQNIDVLWLQNNSFVAAFEIESSTAIYSGLLRMSDLVAMQPNLSIPLYIVAPDHRRAKVCRELNRPTFERRDTPLRNVCQLIPFSAVRDGYQQVKQYAKFMKHTVIEQWAESCERTADLYD